MVVASTPQAGKAKKPPAIKRGANLFKLFILRCDRTRWLMGQAT